MPTRYFDDKLLTSAIFDTDQVDFDVVSLLAKGNTIMNESPPVLVINNTRRKQPVPFKLAIRQN